MSRKNIIKICDYIIEISLLIIIFFTPIYFAFVQENYNIFELNKLALFRILLMVMLLAFVGKMFIKRKRSRLSREAGSPSFFVWFRTPAAKLFLLLFLVGLSYFISTLLSIHPQLSLWGSYARQQGFYSLIHYLLFFVLLILSLKDWRQVKRIIITIISASALVCLYGLLQYFALDPLEWKEKALYTGRIFSSLGQPNFLGQYLIMVLPVSVFGLVFIAKKLISRFLTLILILMQLACLLFTYSRAAWLGLLASLGIFALLYLFIRGYKKLAWSLVGAVLVGTVFIISLCPQSTIKDFKFSESNLLMNRIVSIIDLDGGSNKIRLNYWQASINEFRGASLKRKLFGYGPETSSSIFVKYYRPDWGVHEKINSFPDRAHNVIFDILLQFGLIGLFIILLFYYFIIYRAIKYLIKYQQKNKAKYWLAVALLSTLAGYFINNLFSFSLTVGYVYLYLVLGMLVLIILPGKGLNLCENSFFAEVRPLLSPFSKWLIWLVLFGVCGVFAYYYNIQPLLADYYYMKVKKAEAKGDCLAVLDNMDRAVNLNPISAFYKERYIYHNLNCLDAIESKDGRVDLHDNIVGQADSIGLREYQFSTWTNIAHAKSLFGYYINKDYYQAAEKDYQRLIKINPYITTTYKDLARMKLWQENYGAAIANFKKAIKAAPPLDSPYLNNEHRQEIEDELARLYKMLGMAYKYQQDWNNALYYYGQALDFSPYHLQLYKKIADIYYQQGDLDKAIWYNKRGIILNPEDYNWPFAIALLYKEIGNRDKARKYAEKALELAPEEKEQIKGLLDDLQKKL
ncbi:MAG: O-antigen ligase family protein [Patescibacteria group bacterium]|nr:O-antigen ligase family protein [Patescibacteria group bacterium]